MYNAIFYNNAYLLLPEEFADYDTFINDLNKKSLPAQYNMIVLRENYHASNSTVVKGLSMAPYFLSDYHNEPCRVTIDDPSNIYPAQVWTMSQEEYNSKLRDIISNSCPGCMRFKPLTDRVQSLNSHFDEMTLDGVCMYRQETKPAPRIFRDRLYTFGGFFARNQFEKYDVDSICDEIKHLLNICYSDAKLTETNDKKVLEVRLNEKELLTPILTIVLTNYITKVLKKSYHIIPAEEAPFTKETLTALLSENNSESFRKDCKKYGVSIGVLNYNEEGTEKVHNSLEELIKQFLIFPIF